MPVAAPHRPPSLFRRIARILPACRCEWFKHVPSVWPLQVHARSPRCGGAIPLCQMAGNRDPNANSDLPQSTGMLCDSLRVPVSWLC